MDVDDKLTTPQAQASSLAWAIVLALLIAGIAFELLARP